MKSFVRTISLLLSLTVPGNLLGQPIAAQDTCTQPPTGLVNWWPGDGDAKDRIGHVDGQGGVFAKAEVGQGFSFNGATSVTFGSGVGNFGTSDFTLDFWIATTSGQLQAVIEKRVGCGPESFWGIRSGVRSPGTLFIELLQDATRTNEIQINTNRGVADGLFHNVALVRQGTNVQIYIDGTLDVQGTTPQPVNLVNGASLTAGTSVCVGQGPTQLFTGLLDEIAIFNRALGANDVKSIFQAGTAGMCKDCDVDFQQSISAFAGGPPSLDGKPTTMNGLFVPHDRSGRTMSLASAATACHFAGGFDGFNWQQEVKVLPRPSPYATVEGTPLVTPFLDPPTAGGYTYDPGGTANLYPFYYGPQSCAFRDSNFCVIPVEVGASVLNFFDVAADPCLPGGTGEGCFGLTAPPGPNSALVFTTRLVGVLNGSPVTLPNAEWSWTSTFNGTSGRAAKLNDSVGDPGSGTGGITITSISGVAQTPPSISCNARPNLLWPPDGKETSVNVSGSATAGTQTLVLDSGVFTVTDTEGQIQPDGAVTVGSDGSYSLAVPLLAARNGSNKNSRVYTVRVVISDSIGNVASCSAIVTVPHDQGN